ncbi:hypothetical protein ACFQJC_14490 [Haloferax namakaokahaiae]|uniref:Uncharacterized protein n=1 Tax=Haloferax namakaokahaiae TaxID=1748331 RepID=A0ABD5ZHP7_9EURY
MDVLQTLREMPYRPSTVSPKTFKNQDGSDVGLFAGTAGERSLIASLDADLPTSIPDGEEFRLALPAYETFTLDSTADNTETFELGFPIAECPNTQNIVLWDGSTYIGVPESVTKVNGSDVGEFDITSSNTDTDIHVYYIPDAQGSIEVIKSSPGTSASATQQLFNEQLKLVNLSNQNEAPETFNLGKSKLQGVIPEDYNLDVYVDAPYTVKFSESTDGTSATNALMSFGVRKGVRAIGKPLRDAVATDMARQD